MIPVLRKMTIIAQDPSVRNAQNEIVRSQVSITNEKLGPGPRGHRIHVVDYDAAQRILYKPAELGQSEKDRFFAVSDSTLINDPEFHAQNSYAIIMRILEYFEFALGRRISWGFGGHQIHVAPHAFSDANAYYSEDDHGLFFGYFPGHDGRPVFNCLSHDVLAHEACHALLDGLRNCYTFPSYPDQAGFHEGYADIVALLSIFGLRDIVIRKPKPEAIEFRKNISQSKPYERVLSWDWPNNLDKKQAISERPLCAEQLRGLQKRRLWENCLSRNVTYVGRYCHRLF
jgi:hypothetical protein